MYKLGTLQDDVWKEHIHPKTYAVQNRELTSRRIYAGVSPSDPDLFEHLTLCLTPPYFILYILHTPRGEAEPGRYESPSLSAAEFCGFLHTYRRLLSTDARFEIWSYSLKDDATVVWDRHNQIFAYGPIDQYAEKLHAFHYSVGEPSFSVSHEHHYHPENDAEARALIKALTWKFSPLRPEDEQ